MNHLLFYEYIYYVQTDIIFHLNILNRFILYNYFILVILKINKIIFKSNQI